MQRWLMLTISLILPLSILSGIAVWVGQQQPVPDHIAMLHFDMCEPPCWIGIVPGTTTWTEAETIIRQIYGSEQGYEIGLSSGFLDSSAASGITRTAIIGDSSTGLGFAITVYYVSDDAGDKPIHRLDLTFYGTDKVQLTLADMHRILGRLDSIGMGFTVTLTSVEINHGSVIKTYTFADQRLTFNDVFSTFTFADNSFDEIYPPDVWTKQQWQGFTSLDRYKP